MTSWQLRANTPSLGSLRAVGGLLSIIHSRNRISSSRDLQEYSPAPAQYGLEQRILPTIFYYRRKTVFSKKPLECHFEIMALGFV